MCTVLLGFRTHPAADLIVVANRDEFFGRPTQAPTRLTDSPLIIAGRDELAGGTWLGLNAWGIVGLTNQPSRILENHSRRSRGLLVWDALVCHDAVSAVEQSLNPEHHYHPYNLFAADVTQLVIAYARAGEVRIDRLEPGWHVIPNGFADDRTIPKVQRAFELLKQLPSVDDPRALLTPLQSIMSDHEQHPVIPDEPSWLSNELRRAISALCVHSPHYGTRSISIILRSSAGTEYWYGEGPACQATLVPVVTAS